MNFITSTFVPVQINRQKKKLLQLIETIETELCMCSMRVSGLSRLNNSRKSGKFPRSPDDSQKSCTKLTADRCVELTVKTQNSIN